MYADSIIMKNANNSYNYHMYWKFVCKWHVVAKLVTNQGTNSTVKFPIVRLKPIAFQMLG